jgi:MerR family mercuric resistance operon transcriptional regulator
VARLTFIRRARELGFSLDEVRTMLRLGDERERPCAEVRVVASTHLRDVRAKIADLQAMERVLRATVARCGRGTGSHCPLIEALSRTPVGDASSPGAGRSSRHRMPRPAEIRE